MSAQVLTGIFTLAGVALTATVALVAARQKYRFDRMIASRNDLRGALARAIAIGQEFEDILIVTSRAREDSERVKEIQAKLDSLARDFRVAFSEVQLLTFSGYWHPYFQELIQAYEQKSFIRSGFADTYPQTLQPLYDQLIFGAQKELA
jgi:hypothetical protein